MFADVAAGGTGAGAGAGAGTGTGAATLVVQRMLFIGLELDECSCLYCCF